MPHFRKILVGCTLLVSFNLHAQTKTDTFKTWGNCGMCKERIETAARSAGATAAGWDAETKLLQVSFDSTKTSLGSIQQQIAAAGHDTPLFAATNKAYEALPGCCKYERKEQPAAAATDPVKKTAFNYNPNGAKDTSRRSIPSQAFALVGPDSMTITYHSPGVRNRVIWGGLVPYDEVWVTGAHNATSLVLPVPVKIQDKEIPAGKYALFSIPGKKEWTIILNRNWNQHLASEYDSAEDVIRFQVRPRKNAFKERLQYTLSLQPEKTAGLIRWEWEKWKWEFPFTW